MFENFVKRLLRKYLEDYVDLKAETLDSLALSLWRGSLTIENVSVKKEAIEALLGQNIQILEGVVGLVNVK